MDFDKAVAWIEARWGADVACPMCHGTDWKVNTELGALAGQMDAERNVDFTKAVPIVIAWCQNCGFVAMVDAVTAGLVHP